MRIFDIQNNQPIVTVEALLIPEFKKIWDMDKTKDKSTAHKYLCYIYFTSDYKSLYLSYEKEVREDMIKRDYIGDINWKPTKEVEAGIIKYKELQNTPTMRFLEDNKSAMESMGKYFRSINWDQADANGKPKYDIGKVSAAVQRAGGIIDNIDKLIEKVAKEQSVGAKVRGGSVGGLLEFDEG